MAAKDKEKVEDQSPAAGDADANVPTGDDAEVDESIDNVNTSKDPAVADATSTGGGVPENAESLANDPIVEARIAEVGGNEPSGAAMRALDETKATRQAEWDREVGRAEAMAAPVQKVTDGNEVSALATISGQRPIRDLTDAPAPEPLGPHHESTEKD